jgi:hypothetical protein
MERPISTQLAAWSGVGSGHPEIGAQCSTGGGGAGIAEGYQRAVKRRVEEWGEKEDVVMGKREEESGILVL